MDIVEKSRQRTPKASRRTGDAATGFPASKDTYKSALVDHRSRSGLPNQQDLVSLNHYFGGSGQRNAKLIPHTSRSWVAGQQLKLFLRNSHSAPLRHYSEK